MVKRKNTRASYSRGRTYLYRGRMEENASVTVGLKPPQRPGHVEEHPSALGATTRAQQLPLYSDSATKFALLQKNCPIVVKMRTRGDFCTVRGTHKPSKVGVIQPIRTWTL